MGETAEIIQVETEKVLDEKYDTEEYAYLKNSGFTSELYKIEVKNLPKFYGHAEIKKLFSTTLGLNSNKIKIPRRNCPFGFVCFRNEEDRQKAIEILNGYKWKGNILKAFPSNPIQDPLFKKRKDEDSSNKPQKKPKTVAESSEPLGHLPYEEQLEIKQKKIDNVLAQFKTELKKAINYQGKADMNEYADPEIEIKPIIPSPQPTGYRNKCEFTIGRDANDEIQVGNRLGSYISGSIHVEAIDDLKIPPEKMKLAAKVFKKFVEQSKLDVYNPSTYEGYFRQLAIRLHDDEKAMMIIVGIHPQTMTDDEKVKFQDDVVKFFTEGEGKCLNVNCIYYEEIQKIQSGQQGKTIKHIYGDTHVHDYIHGLKFQISASSFFQGNTKGAAKLYQEIIDLANPTPKTVVLDVCCGTGTIGLCIAKYCKEVYGMEIIPQAIEDAKVNAEMNGIKNAIFSAGNADDLIYTMVKQANVDDDEEIVAIVDPPRAGLTTKSIMQLRNSTKIKKLIYVSCSPKQVIKNFVDLSKNCSKTMKGEPFVAKIARAVDMFPHTDHCELVVLFERKEN
ncbi:hypothetical protein PVAND_015751 [Polypedilum vanderplanki]|uniref:tRNA (uracil(54)-C(5))-methyltransferase n=1 Tax=Polypedilum vanderplanki TaxID=319348 RepID=A0A9J6BDF9_POLVA|nr:hypothetical protein PVAND_015751 [Polypedilum vanderplanki]